MVWTVTSSLDAEDQLTMIYMSASEPNAVSRASNEIDGLLRADPLTQGTASGRERILYVPPLGVVFEVEPADRMVKIKEYYHSG